MDADSIAGMADLSPLDALTQDVIEALTPVLERNSGVALDALDVTDSKLFGLANDEAADWARNRAAELVGRQWHAGVLVDNPNPRWAITDGTRDGIRRAVVSAYEDGMTPAQLGRKLRDDYAFSPERAKLIAKTETAKASVQGTLIGWKASGVVTGKQVIMSDDHDHDDECDSAEAMGVVDIDDDFGGIGDVPFHPGCECTEVPATLNSDVEEGDDASDDDVDKALPENIFALAKYSDDQPRDEGGRWAEDGVKALHAFVTGKKKPPGSREHAGSIKPVR